MPSPVSRLSFSDWLCLQQSDAPVAASEPSSSDNLAAPARPTELSLRQSSTQKPFRLVTSLPDCRAERRNITDSKGQQEIQLTLLPPPNMQAAPLNVSLEQVDKLLPHLTEPLLSLHIGELSRSLYPNPKQLAPTGETGVLQLWLTAASMLNLVWVHQRQHMPFSMQAAGNGMRDVWMQTTQVLASIPCTGQTSTNAQPQLSGWRLDQDASGRSFCLQLNSNREEEPSDSQHPQQQWYFWARTQPDQRKIDRLLSLTRSLPSLAQLSGVRQAKLDEIAKWTMQAHQSCATMPPAASSSSSAPSSAPMTQQQHELASANSDQSSAAPQQQSSSNSVQSDQHGDDSPAGTSGTVPSEQADSEVQAGRMRHVQVTAVQGATASAFMTEPAWGIAQTLRVQVKAGIRLAGSSHNSAELLSGMMARGALLAKQQADASAKQEAARLGWQRLEALAAQKAVLALQQPEKACINDSQVHCSIEALRRRLRSAERRRCRDHPSRHPQSFQPSDEALHEAQSNGHAASHRGHGMRSRRAKRGAARCERADSWQRDCGANAQSKEAEDQGENDTDIENVAPGSRVDLSTLQRLLQ